MGVLVVVYSRTQAVSAVPHSRRRLCLVCGTAEISYAFCVPPIATAAGSMHAGASAGGVRPSKGVFLLPHVTHVLIENCPTISH